MSLLDATSPSMDWAVESAYGDDPISDDELAALALASDPNPEIDPSAVPFTPYEHRSDAPLPQWYMPPTTARAAGGWRVPIVASVVLALVLINALGLCITYGVLVVA